MDVRLNLPDKNDIEARATLPMISDASEILHKLLDGGHSTVAGSLQALSEISGKYYC
jgi:hypothetical protein